MQSKENNRPPPSTTALKAPRHPPPPSSTSSVTDAGTASSAAALHARRQWLPPAPEQLQLPLVQVSPSPRSSHRAASSPFPPAPSSNPQSFSCRRILATYWAVAATRCFTTKSRRITCSALIHFPPPNLSQTLKPSSLPAQLPPAYALAVCAVGLTRVQVPAAVVGEEQAAPASGGNRRVTCGVWHVTYDV